MEDLNMLKDLDITAIMEYQKNRYPYLLIDYVSEVMPGKSAKGYKNLTMNEWFFPCHYPGCPNMPGMLQIEALVQMFIMTFLTIPEFKGKVTNFLGADNVRFHKRVTPGKRLDIEAELKSFRRGIAKGKAAGYVDGELACEAEFIITIPEELERFTPKRG